MEVEVGKQMVEEMGGGVRKEDVEVVEGEVKLEVVMVARVGRAGPMLVFPSGKPSSSLARTSSGRWFSVMVGGHTVAKAGLTLTGCSRRSPAV